MRFFPLLFIAVILYNLLAFGDRLADDAAMQAFLSHHSVAIPMFSGENWIYSIGDMFITLALILLFIEVIKSTRSTSREIVNHGLSMLTFVIALVEFIVLKAFSTSVFFFITAFAFFDVIAGYTISIVTAEHNLGVVRESRPD